MFSRLPESNAKSQRRTGGLVVSTAVHLAIIALAVRATGLTATPTPPRPVVTPLYLPRTPDAPPPPPPVRRLQRDATMPPSPNHDLLPPVIDATIPNHIPDPNSMANLLEPTFEPTSRSVATRSGAMPNVSSGSPLREDQVEQPVVAIPGTATPRYPSMLQSAGIEGDVRIQFVVDTLGRVERASVQVAETSNDLFSVAVREALARARFAPAQVGGRKVRQLVEQTFTFRISR